MDTFLIYKALHLIFMVTWFAGLFYLPRIFVYHAMAEDEISIGRFKVMERKLYYGIMTPGMILTIIFGILTLLQNGIDFYIQQLWFQIKLALIIVLIIYHIYCGKLVAIFKFDLNNKSHVWYRWFNEIPVIFLFVIIFLAVLKPV